MAGRGSTIRDRVQKLLNQAADQEGTPEAEAFYAKAFGLMAQYGVDERDLAGDGHSSELAKRTFEFTGTYTDMQMQLLNAIASGLHCAAVAMRRQRAVGVVSGTVFGVHGHVERVEMVFAMLNPMMAALSAGLSPVARRRSFMQGFAAEIRRRLDEAEAGVDDGSGGYGLVLLDDASRAEGFMRDVMEDEGIDLSTHRQRRRLDAEAFGQGAAAARHADLGQPRVADRKGLTAAG